MNFLEKASNSRDLIWLKIEVKLKKIESLMVNWGSIYINPKLKITMKKALKFEAHIEIWRGQNYIKSKVWGKLGDAIENN
jgi:hypothetical protein